MTPPLLEAFDCPNTRCARPLIVRPLGSETWHPCGEHIPARGFMEASQRILTMGIPTKDVEAMVIEEAVSRG